MGESSVVELDVVVMEEEGFGVAVEKGKRNVVEEEDEMPFAMVVPGNKSNLPICCPHNNRTHHKTNKVNNGMK